MEAAIDGEKHAIEQAARRAAARVARVRMGKSFQLACLNSATTRAGCFSCGGQSGAEDGDCSDGFLAVISFLPGHRCNAVFKVRADQIRTCSGY
jgi:hypothetical protein